MSCGSLLNSSLNGNIEMESLLFLMLITPSYMILCIRCRRKRPFYACSPKGHDLCGLWYGWFCVWFVDGGKSEERASNVGSFQTKIKMMGRITNIEQEIQDYNEKIKTGKYPNPGKQCRHCKQEVAEEDYKLHDQRSRQFRIVVDALIKIITTILIRWRCPLCKRTFTAYPDFALPYKLYPSTPIAELCENYLEEEMRYEDAAKDGLHRISYPEEYGRENGSVEEGHESFLASSTIWRWIGWMGKLVDATVHALDMIRQACPKTALHRKFIPSSPSKSRSAERKIILENASWLLRIRAEYNRIFSFPFFPHLAIGRHRE